VILLALDPGKVCLGWCAFKDNVLTHAGLSVIAPAPRTRVNVLAAIHEHNIRQCFSGHPSQVYVEQMSLNTGRDYSRGKAIRTANDLLVITNIAASVVSLLGGELVHVPIGTWKSGPKVITKNRVLATLTPDELDVLNGALRGVRPSIGHNLFDAAGIGLYATRRYRIRG